MTESNYCKALVCFTLGFLLFVSCQPEIDVLENTFRSGHAELTGSGEIIHLLFDSQAGSASIDINTNCAWAADFVNNRASWCTLSKDYGKRGTTTLVISVEENFAYDERSASLIITHGDLKKTIIVTQKQQDAVLISRTRYELGSKGGSISIEVQANVEYTCTIADDTKDWVSTTSTKSLSSHELTFDVAANECVERREGRISFTSNVGTEIVHIYQEGETPTLVLSIDQIEMPSDGGEFYVQVRSNVIFYYIIPKDCDWLREIATKTVSTNTLYFSVSENESFSDRKTTLTIKCDNPIMEETITVMQKESHYERDVLVEFYKCMEGDNWSRKDNWCTDKPLSEWFGISVNSSGRVKSIDLKSNGLLGKIPLAISKLTDLTRFDVEGNEINNVDALCSCTKLEELNLSDNIINNLTNNIGSLQELKTLKLSGNQISVLPISLCSCSKLEAIDLGDCLISSLPLEFNKLRKLKKIDLAFNKFSSFPEVLCSLESLEEIKLQFNYEMVGTIPESIGNLSSLRLLALCDNLKMTGSLPRSLFLLPCWKCSFLDIITGTHFEINSQDFVAPDFDIAAFDGTRIVSSQLYSQHKYTILYANEATENASLAELKRLWAEKKDEVAIVSFSPTYCTSRIDTYIKEYDIDWPCVVISPDMSFSGISGFNSFMGKHVTATDLVMIVNQLGQVVYTNYEDDNIYGFITGNTEVYESTDYSRDGDVEILQQAKQGKGVDIVIMGDWYTDDLIKDETYMSDMRYAMECFFEIEPYKTFRDLFNVYAVIGVSRNNKYLPEKGLETAFSVDVRGQFGVRCKNTNKVREYAQLAVGHERAKTATVINVVNSWGGRSVCYIGDFSIAICCCPHDPVFKYVVIHEAGGHGFGRLADEYVDGAVASTSYGNSAEHLDFSSDHKQWLNRNVDTNGDPETIVWKHFLNDSRYEGEVGIYEGGYYLRHGVYRPSLTSIMCGAGESVFNAPSREAIFYHIHKKAFGDQWNYNYETFVKYDAINRVQTKSVSTNKKTKIFDIREVTAPPILLDSF